MFGDIAVFRLPCPLVDPALKGPVPHLAGRVLSVLVQNEWWAAVDFELQRLLSAQKPRSVVITATRPYTVEQVQRLLHICYGACDNVSIAGTFGRVGSWGEAVPICIPRHACAFCLLDIKPEGSAHGNTIAIFGDMTSMCELNVHSDCHVVLAGELRPTMSVCIKGRSLVVNGFRIPVGGDDACYQFTNMKI